MRRSGSHLLVITAGYGMLGTMLAACSTGMATLSPITGRGEAVSNLFRLSLILSLGVFLLVAGALLYILVQFRLRLGEPEPPQTPGNRRLEIIWTVTPALILAGLFALTPRH